MNAVSRRLPMPVRRAVRSLVPERWRATLHYYLVGEPQLIKSELSQLGNKPWDAFASRRPTVRMTERVVEIPWVLSRYRGERRVLDVGSANAVSLYLDHLRRLGIPELQGVDLSAKAVKGIHMTQADVRKMPFEDGFFDLILCVSTLEHIGLDNSGYGLSASTEQTGDVRALREMRRVLRPGGRLLLTVPFGRAGDYGWFRQYDIQRWHELTGAANLRAAEIAYYAYTPEGWQKVDDAEPLQAGRFGQGGAPASQSVLCAALTY